MKLTNKQREALTLIRDAGEAGLDFYWYPMPKGWKVKINGNCARGLRDRAVATFTWRKEGETSIQTAHLTEVGRKALLPEPRYYAGTVQYLDEAEKRDLEERSKP